MFEKILQKIDPKELCKQLGYNKKLLPHCYKKLQKLKEAKKLHHFFLRGGYDFHLSAKEFVKKLCEIYEIPGCKENIQEAEWYEERLAKQFRSFIFVDTEFKRKNEPLFALAAMEGLRRIYLDPEWLVDTPFDDQLLHISKIVQRHYIENEGRLTLWGPIVRYAYYFDENFDPVVFMPDGRVVSMPVYYSEASVKIKGKDFTSFLQRKKRC